MYAKSNVMLGKHSALDSSMGAWSYNWYTPSILQGMLVEAMAGPQQMQCDLGWDLLERRRRLVDSVA